MSEYKMKHHHSETGKHSGRIPSWIDGGSEILPMGCKMKHEAHMEGAGQVAHYPDTYEAVQSVQKREVAKIHGHKIVQGERE